MPTEQYDQATRIRAVTELGVSVPGDLHALQRAPFEQAKEMLKEMKVKVKRNYGLLCLKYHPDVNGGDPEKTKWFKVLSYEKDQFLDLEVRPSPPPIPQPVMVPMGVHIRVGGGVPFAVPVGVPFGMPVGGIGVNTSSATTTGTGMPGFTVSFIRFR